MWEASPALGEQLLLETRPCNGIRRAVVLCHLMICLGLVVFFSDVLRNRSAGELHPLVQEPSVSILWQYRKPLGARLPMQPAKAWQSPGRMACCTWASCRSLECFQVQPAAVWEPLSLTRGRHSKHTAGFSGRWAALGTGQPRGTLLAPRASPEDLIYRVISKNQEVSVISIVGTRAVAEAMSRHETSPTATAALGRGIMSACLLGAFKGDNESIQLTFEGDGPLGQLTAISDNTGMMKGKVDNPLASPPKRPDGKLNVGAAVGKGQLTVTRSHPAWKEPYSAAVEITSGEIGDDVVRYLQESEQINGVVAVGVSLEPPLRIRSAGGYMLQLLPFASEETITSLEKIIPALPSPTDMVASGMSAKQIAEAVLGELGIMEEMATTKVPQYGPCDRDEIKFRMLRALANIGRKEITSIIEERGAVEMSDQFCKETFVFLEDEITTGLKSMGAAAWQIYSEK